MSDWNSTCFILWKINRIQQLIRYFLLLLICIIYLVSGPMFVCVARTVNQQPSVVDGMTGGWGKGVRGPPSVWWSFIPPPFPIQVLFSVTYSVVFWVLSLMAKHLLTISKSHFNTNEVG